MLVVYYLHNLLHLLLAVAIVGSSARAPLCRDGLETRTVGGARESLEEGRKVVGTSSLSLYLGIVLENGPINDNDDVYFF